jgi:hypothetical protein
VAVALVWLIPCTLAVAASGLLIGLSQAVRSELALLYEERRGLAALRYQARLVQAESRRTAQAAALTLDSLAPPARR